MGEGGNENEGKSNKSIQKVYVFELSIWKRKRRKWETAQPFHIEWNENNSCLVCLLYRSFRSEDANSREKKIVSYFSDSSKTLQLIIIIPFLVSIHDFDGAQRWMAVAVVGGEKHT